MFDRSSMPAVRKLPRGTKTVEPSGYAALHMSIVAWIAKVHKVELSPTAPWSVIEQSGPVMGGLSPVLTLLLLGPAAIATAAAAAVLKTNVKTAAAADEATRRDAGEGAARDPPGAQGAWSASAAAGKGWGYGWKGYETAKGTRPGLDWEGARKRKGQ